MALCPSPGAADVIQLHTNKVETNTNQFARQISFASHAAVSPFNASFPWRWLSATTSAKDDPEKKIQRDQFRAHLESRENPVERPPDTTAVPGKLL